ncbi:MAG: protein kinase domain-containing protein, partial [Alphaproteobacteria bacterium]
MADAKKSSQVVIRDRYEVLSGEPMPDFNAGTAQAYRARDSRDARTSLFALVCDPRAPVRLDEFSASGETESPYLMRLSDWAIAEWPLTGAQTPILVFPRPEGGRLFSLVGAMEPMHEDLAMENLVKPLYHALRDCRNVGMLHRNIRPDNMFLDATVDGKVILGQCLSALPGTTQPFVCETIESSMTLPFGRGPGTIADDMYSVGVLLAAALSGKIPGQGMTEEDILYAKMSEGSFGMMTREGRFSLTMMEALRGLLNDDVLERWTLEDFGQWANGRRGTPIQVAAPMRASRSFSFAERNFFTCREIGYAMSKNWDQAAAIIHDGSLDDWLRRALGDSNMVEAVGVAKMDLPPSEIENNDIVVTRVCIALDPDAPIRFRELSVMVDGIQSLIASLDENRSTLGLVAQVLNYNFLNFWIENQTSSRTDLMDLVRTLTQIRDIL